MLSILVFILILILILIIACSNKLIYFGGNFDKKHTNKHKFLFPIFGLNSKNKILQINSNNFLTKNNFSLKLDKNDIRSIILQTYNYPDKVGIINHILHKLIYPIKFDNNKLYTEEWRKAIKYIYTDYNLPPKINLNWQIPRGLYLHKILEDYECDILTDLFLKVENNFTIHHTRNRTNFDYVTVNNDTYSNKNNLNINYFISQLKDKKLIYEFKKCINKFFDIFYKKYDKKIDTILHNITIGFYSTNNKNTGKSLHIDNYDYDYNIGPVSIISLNNSILDFVPSKQTISHKEPFRVLVPKGYCVTFDGDLRHYYAHGVPKNIPFPNKYRVGINIRHLLFDKQHNNNYNCELKHEIKSKYPCTSASFDNPLSFI